MPKESDKIFPFVLIQLKFCSFLNLKAIATIPKLSTFHLKASQQPLAHLQAKVFNNCRDIMLSFLSSWALLSLSFPWTTNFDDLHSLHIVNVFVEFGGDITLSLLLFGCQLTSYKGTLPEFILSRSSI